MADVAKRIGPTVGTGAAATLYTCAVTNGFLWRHMSITNITTTPQLFSLSIGNVATNGLRLYHDVTVDPGVPFDWSGLRFIANTETIQWIGTTNLVACINGVEQ